ncbi:ABC transporter substrate-binding protein [Longimycelium tulufanense]|uniref:ABC transporter substrate-binding protein n=1 Tax=Longimycelium tulufanense TaxID=907463 RepID=A0A8J3CCX3_9PSEU|nr:ABC transporter substrate-binding protein [Longimycelium tulufanense]
MLGVVYVAVVAAFLAFTVAVYEDVFGTDVPVTLRAGQAGNQMQADADVKLRGIAVGRVRSVTSTGDGAVLELAMDPAMMDRVPRNVSAQLLPKTLFGERYVNLVMPQRPDTVRLSAGDVIGQDRSANSIELERVLNNLLPLLQTVQPEKLSATLTTLSRVLEGRGKPLGRTMVQIGHYLGELTPQMPEIKADITRFATVADTYGDAADDILQALSDFTVTSKTLVDQRLTLQAMYRTLTAASSDVTAFLQHNSDNLIALTGSSRPTLELFAKYAPGYLCMLTAVADFVPRVDKAFGKNIGEPGLKVNLSVVHDRGKYLPNRDEPVYNDKTGPRCYGPDAEPATVSHVDGDGLGPANSPAERQMIATLLAPALKVEPNSVAAWGSLLVGPLYRGVEVRVE